MNRTSRNRVISARLRRKPIVSRPAFPKSQVKTPTPPPKVKTPTPPPKVKTPTPPPKVKTPTPPPKVKTPTPPPKVKTPTPPPKVKTPSQVKTTPTPSQVKIQKSRNSSVRYDPKLNMVVKTPTTYKETFDREVYWLHYFNEKGYTWCPKLYKVNKSTGSMYIEYIGPRINKNNAPKDWRGQLQNILSDLRREGVRHNDIKHEDLLIKDNKLYLIDYGWVSVGSDWSCGKKFSARKKPCHMFKDETAIQRIAKHLNR